MPMSNICLRPMTPVLARTYFKDFSYDPDVFEKNQPIPEFQYDENWVEHYFRKQQELHRVHLAILQDGMPIGEIILKKIHKPRAAAR